jgi:hypothetical protein
VASLARPLHDEHEADAVAAMYEAERALRTAQRLLERAADLLRS